MSVKVNQTLHGFIESIEMLFVAVAIIAFMLYPSLKTNVEVSYGLSGEKIQITGSDLALNVQKGLRATNESTFFKRIYELPTVESSDLSEMDATMTETFESELAEVATHADNEKVTATVDEDGFLIVYDPKDNLEIQDDVPVFVVPLGEDSGYVFGFSQDPQA